MQRYLRWWPVVVFALMIGGMVWAGKSGSDAARGWRGEATAEDRDWQQFLAWQAELRTEDPALYARYDLGMKGTTWVGTGHNVDEYRNQWIAWQWKRHGANPSHTTRQRLERNIQP